MSEYHKIMGPFKRFTEGPNRNKVIPWAWSTPEFQTLSHPNWHWTEKVDGTNIRVIWDGHRVSFGDRMLMKVKHADLYGVDLSDMFGE